MTPTGRIIVMEGIDGCGKTTQARRLVERYRADGVSCLSPREPGATPLGEQIRSMVLDHRSRIGSLSEMLLYAAARAQMCADVLVPAVERGDVVILDRFWPSTLAYQGYGLGVDVDLIEMITQVTLRALPPITMIWIDVPVAHCAQRRAAEKPDRIEARGLEYMETVRRGYQDLCQRGLMSHIDGTADPDQVHQRIWDMISS
jgi:dTMP kinase